MLLRAWLMKSLHESIDNLLPFCTRDRHLSGEPRDNCRNPLVALAMQDFA
jgi:hypothetical protein